MKNKIDMRQSNKDICASPIASTGVGGNRHNRHTTSTVQQAFKMPDGWTMREIEGAFDTFRTLPEKTQRRIRRLVYRVYGNRTITRKGR